MLTMDSEYALGRMVKKGAPVKPGFVFPYWQSPQPVSLMVMPWQDKPPANRSGIADGKHGVLGAPMQMQCKETHKCSQKQISWVRVKFSKSPAESPETVTSPRGTSLQLGLSISCHGSKSEPKSPNPANRFEKNRFLKEVPNMDCFARYRVAT